MNSKALHVVSPVRIISLVLVFTLSLTNGSRAVDKGDLAEVSQEYKDTLFGSFLAEGYYILTPQGNTLVQKFKNLQNNIFNKDTDPVFTAKVDSAVIVYLDAASAESAANDFHERRGIQYVVRSVPLSNILDKIFSSINSTTLEPDVAIFNGIAMKPVTPEYLIEEGSTEPFVVEKPECKFIPAFLSHEEEEAARADLMRRFNKKLTPKPSSFKEFLHFMEKWATSETPVLVFGSNAVQRMADYKPPPPAPATETPSTP